MTTETGAIPPEWLQVGWYEMPEVRKRPFEQAVWIPLRAIQDLGSVGSYGEENERHHFFGAATLAIPLDQRTAAEKLGWTDVGIAHDHHPYVDAGEYVPVDVELHNHVGVRGVRLVLEQRGNHAESREWHLNPDLVIGLGLKREGDEWVAIHEDYAVVARLTRRDGRAVILEIRAEHLKDYLCARNMALLISSYRERRITVANASWVTWPRGTKEEKPMLDRWAGRVHEIHEGGMPFGGQTAVFHMSRTDVDESDDVPTLSAEPDEKDVRSSSWTKGDNRRKLFVVRGELWRLEWIEPSEKSSRVRGDRVPSQVAFIVDASGKRMTAEDLKDQERWLWFRPAVVPALIAMRGGGLGWHTQDTGSVRCSPDYSVHFGLNRLGLVSVYAEDIATLPEWQQRIWAGHNVGPEGGVSSELLDSQVRAEPAETLAPEEYMRHALQTLSDAGQTVCGQPIVRWHKDADKILERTHRFRSLDDPGFLALAKDLARLSADSLDVTAIRMRLAGDELKLGSLKSLEALAAKGVAPDKAKDVLGPLFAIYDLRLADAHLPGDLAHARPLLGVDPGSPHVIQGRDMLRAFVTAIYRVADVVDKLPSPS